MWSGIVSLTLALGACDGSTDGGLVAVEGVDGAPDAAPDASTVDPVEPDMAAPIEPAVCAVEWAPFDDGAALGPGTRLEVRADPGADLSARGEHGFAVYPAPDADDRWWVRLPYRAGAVELAFEARCPDGATTRHARTVEIRPATWRRLAEWAGDGDGPPAREYFSMWVDPVDQQRLWVHGGFHYRPRQFTAADDLWVTDLDDLAWTAVEQDSPGPVVGGAGFTVLPGGRQALAIGGLRVDADGGTLVGGLHQLDHEGASATWSEIEFERPVVAGYQPAFFLHPDAPWAITTGGQGAFGPHMRSEWYALDGSDRGVLPVEPGDAPTGRTGFAWGFAGRRLAVFSGEQGGGAGSACNCAEDTWFLDAHPDGAWSWTRFDSPDTPAGRRNPVYAVDPVEQRLLVWGGTPDGRTSVPGLEILHFAPGAEAWVTLDVQLGPDGPAPVRSSGRAAFDPARSRVVLGFGNTPEALYTDLWSLSL